MTSLDINFANNILSSIMNCTLIGITTPFLSPAEPLYSNPKEYKAIIKEPICLKEIQKKLCNAEYVDIKEFVCDFRLMLFNCYRYFGCDSKMGKCAAKLEAMFEQKILLLPIDLRVKTSMDAILADDDIRTESLENGRRRYSERLSSSDMGVSMPMKRMMDEIEKNGSISSMFADNQDFKVDPLNFLTMRLLKWQEKRRNIQYIRGFDDWYQENTTESDRKVLDTCSEFVEFIQFISIGYAALGLNQLLADTMKIDHITTEDLRFAVLFPQTSRLLAAIVPLITTISKNRISVMKSPLPSYERWNELLCERVSFFHRQWRDKALCDTPDLFIKRFGVDPIMFQVLGQRRPVTDRRQFHELSVFQRCHLLLAMCCWSLRSQDSIHFAMDRSIDWEEHRRIVLARVGECEYVRFSGLGAYCGFYVYRMKALVMDPLLAAYCTQDTLSPMKRKKKTPVLDKYRMPKWHAAEVRKAKAAKKAITSKRKLSSVDKKKRPSEAALSETIESIVCQIHEDLICDNKEADKSPSDNEATKLEPTGSEQYSVSNNDEESNIESIHPLHENLDDDNEEEEEILEILGPVDGEIELVARDLAGVMRLISEIKDTMSHTVSENEEEWEEYKVLLENLEVVRIYFEENESMRVIKMQDGRLRLRKEMQCNEAGYGHSLVEYAGVCEKEEVVSGQEEEEDGESGDRYTESEIRALASKTRAGRSLRSVISRTNTSKRKMKYTEVSDDSLDNENEDEEAETRFGSRRRGGGAGKRRRIEESEEEDDDEEEEARFGSRRRRGGGRAGKRRRIEESEEEEDDDEEEARFGSRRRRGASKRRRINESENEEDEEEVTLVGKRGRGTLKSERVEESENRAPEQSANINASNTDLQHKVKRKVFQIYNDFFTDELVPVRVKEDGSLESLPLDSVTEERYALARKMIDLYKHKTGSSLAGAATATNGYHS